MLSSFSCYKFKREEITPSTPGKSSLSFGCCAHRQPPGGSKKQKPLVSVHLPALGESRLYPCVCTKAGAGGGDADSSK